MAITSSPSTTLLNTLQTSTEPTIIFKSRSLPWSPKLGTSTTTTTTNTCSSTKTNTLWLCPIKSVDDIASGYSCKWKTRVSFFQGFLTKGRDVKSLKEELFVAIALLDRGANATPQDQELVDQIARKLEAVNEIKEPLKSNLLDGKWELLYTTSQSVLQTQRPKFLRPNGKIFQAINQDTLRAQNMETWPFFNQATANLVPLNARRVAVKFDYFKILGLIPIKNPGSGRGQLEITYLDEELRISRGDRGNLFILKMVDPSYRVPL